MTGAAHIRELSCLRAGDADRFGGKSASLGELLAAEIPVPGGFALSTDAFRAFIDGAGLNETIADALRGAGEGVDGLQAAARRIEEAILAAEVPEAVAAEVAQSYAGLGDEEPPVAVRSSALGEDSADATFAGQQETILWVRGAEAVTDAIRRCWASLFSAEAISYRRRLGESAAAPAMGVTVQRMVDAAISGVLFTCNPVTGDRSMVAVNASWGLGLAVVGGEVTPDDHLVSKVTGEIVRETIADKQVQYVPRDDGRGTERVEVAQERRGARCLDEAALADLVDLARRIEQHFGAPQDVEWARDAEGEVFVLQARPVTGLPQRPDRPRPSSALDMVMGTFGAAKRSEG